MWVFLEMSNENGIFPLAINSGRIKRLQIIETTYKLWPEHRISFKNAISLKRSRAWNYVYGHAPDDKHDDSRDSARRSWANVFASR